MQVPAALLLLLLDIHGLIIRLALTVTYTADAFIYSFNLIKTQPLVAFEAPQQLTVCTVSDLPLALDRLMVFTILHGKSFLITSSQRLVALVGMI